MQQQVDNQVSMADLAVIRQWMELSNHLLETLVNSVNVQLGSEEPIAFWHELELIKALPQKLSVASANVTVSFLYRCQNCGTEFDRPASESGGGSHYYGSSYKACPSCRHSSITRLTAVSSGK